MIEQGVQRSPVLFPQGGDHRLVHSDRGRRRNVCRSAVAPPGAAAGAADASALLRSAAALYGQPAAAPVYQAPLPPAPAYAPPPTPFAYARTPSMHLPHLHQRRRRRPGADIRLPGQHRQQILGDPGPRGRPQRPWTRSWRCLPSVSDGPRRRSDHRVLRSALSLLLQRAQGRGAPRGCEMGAGACPRRCAQTGPR